MCNLWLACVFVLQLILPDVVDWTVDTWMWSCVAAAERSTTQWDLVSILRCQENKADHCYIWTRWRSTLTRHVGHFLFHLLKFKKMIMCVRFHWYWLDCGFVSCHCACWWLFVSFVEQLWQLFIAVILLAELMTNVVNCLPVSAVQCSLIDPSAVTVVHSNDIVSWTNDQCCKLSACDCCSVLTNRPLSCAAVSFTAGCSQIRPACRDKSGWQRGQKIPVAVNLAALNQMYQGWTKPMNN